MPFILNKGYIQLIDIAKLQHWANKNDGFINVAMLPVSLSLQSVP